MLGIGLGISGGYPDPGGGTAQYAEAALSGAASLSGVLTCSRAVVAALAVAASCSGSATRERRAEATLSGSAAIAALATRERHASAALACSLVVAADGTIRTVFATTYEDVFRVAETAKDVYELFVGVDQEPDFEASDQPVATSASLPMTFTPVLPSSGDAVLYVVVRKRSKHDLSSFNVFSKRVQFENSVEVLGPLTDPTDLVVYDAATGYLRCVAGYSRADDESPADTWDLYVKIGSDPVPGVDSPVATQAMAFLGDIATLHATVGPYTPGTTAHVLAVARRTSDTRRALSDVVEHVLADTLDLEQGSLFGGEAYEQF